LSAQHQTPGVRAFNARYNVTTEDRRRLRTALSVLVDLGPAVERALTETAFDGRSLAGVVCALRPLVDGPKP